MTTVRVHVGSRAGPFLGKHVHACAAVCAREGVRVCVHGSGNVNLFLLWSLRERGYGGVRVR